MRIWRFILVFRRVEERLPVRLRAREGVRCIDGVLRSTRLGRCSTMVFADVGSSMGIEKPNCSAISHALTPRAPPPPATVMFSNTLGGSSEKARQASAISHRSPTWTAPLCRRTDFQIVPLPPIEAVWLATALLPASESPPVDDHGLARGDIFKDFKELSSLVDAFHVHGDDLGFGIVTEIGEELRLTQVGAVAEADHLREADAHPLADVGKVNGHAAALGQEAHRTGLPREVGARQEGEPAPGAVDAEAVRSHDPDALCGNIPDLLFEPPAGLGSELGETRREDLGARHALSPALLEGCGHFLRRDRYDGKVDSDGYLVEAP